MIVIIIDVTPPGRGVLPLHSRRGQIGVPALGIPPQTQAQQPAISTHVMNSHIMDKLIQPKHSSLQSAYMSWTDMPWTNPHTFRGPIDSAVTLVQLVNHVYPMSALHQATAACNQHIHHELT